MTQVESSLNHLPIESVPTEYTLGEKTISLCDQFLAFADENKILIQNPISSMQEPIFSILHLQREEPKMFDKTYLWLVTRTSVIDYSVDRRAEMERIDHARLTQKYHLEYGVPHQFNIGNEIEMLQDTESHGRFYFGITPEHGARSYFLNKLDDAMRSTARSFDGRSYGNDWYAKYNTEMSQDNVNRTDSIVLNIRPAIQVPTLHTIQDLCKEHQDIFMCDIPRTTIPVHTLDGLELNGVGFSESFPSYKKSYNVIITACLLEALHDTSTTQDAFLTKFLNNIRRYKRDPSNLAFVDNTTFKEIKDIL